MASGNLAGVGAGAVLLNNRDNYAYDPDAKVWINERFQRIAEIIHDFDPSLSLVWIPEGQRDETDTKPYALCHEPAGQAPYIIFHLDEDDLDHRLIASIFQARSDADNLVAVIDAQEAAQKAVELKETMAMQEEEREKAKFLFNSPKHRINLGDGKVLDK